MVICKMRCSCLSVVWLESSMRLQMDGSILRRDTCTRYMSIASIPPQTFASSENLIARRSFSPLLRLLGIAEDFFTNNPLSGLIQIVVECPRDLQILGPQCLLNEGL